jgi:superfamily II DNA or RNA helicase
MLSLIHKDNVNLLLNDYPELNEFSDNIFLMEDKTKQYYILPRYVKVNYNKDYIISFNDKHFKTNNIDIEFTVSLRDEQKSLITIIDKLYDKNGYVNGIIKAKPGFGKTVCAAYLTAHLKKKTLIVLDNSKLVDQWKEAYINFTSLTEDDIGFIIGKKFDPKTVTITMVQTLVSKAKNDITDYYKKIRDEGFDIVFFDEMHKTTSTTKFGQASLFLNTPNIIGLTATPYGDEEHKFFMKNIIGDIIFEYSNYDEKPEIYFIKYKSGLKQYKQKMLYINDYIRRSGFYNKILSESTNYLKVIHKLAEKLEKTDRKTIIIVFTIDQMNAVVEYLRINGIKATELYSKKQSIDKINDKFIVATYKLASHGFDHAELSCLILATPLKGKTSLVQTIGRILRKKETKNKPIVFDLIDCEMGNIFLDTISHKKRVLSTEFKVDNFKEIDIL